MKLVRALSPLAVALATFACTTLSAEEQPALIERPTPGGHAELLRILAQAFNGRPVTIADDALTRESVLVIERREPRSLEGSPAGGRVLERPEQFRLVLRDGHCELIRSSDQRRWELSETSCVLNRG